MNKLTDRQLKDIDLMTFRKRDNYISNVLGAAELENTEILLHVLYDIKTLFLLDDIYSYSLVIRLNSIIDKVEHLHDKS